MTNQATAFRDIAGEAGQKLSETASDVKSKVSEMGRTAADKIDESRGTVASGLEKTASALKDSVESLPGVDTLNRMTQATADYVRENDFKKMIGDAQSLVKNNPGPSILVAA